MCKFSQVWFRVEPGHYSGLHHEATPSHLVERFPRGKNRASTFDGSLNARMYRCRHFPIALYSGRQSPIPMGLQEFDNCLVLQIRGLLQHLAQDLSAINAQLLVGRWVLKCENIGIEKGNLQIDFHIQVLLRSNVVSLNYRAHGLRYSSAGRSG